MVRKRILFVDDEQSLREVVHRFLTQLGYEVVLASNAEQAMEILQMETFPLVITDLRMPGADGTSLCRTIRTAHPDSIIYALSAYMPAYKTDSLEKDGFDGFLCKPVNSETLRRAVEGAFNKYFKHVSSRSESAM